MHQHIEAKNLSPIELLTFDRNPNCCPEFIENFKIMVHLKTTFNNTIRMERQLSVLKGDAKRSVESIGRNGIFYATTLKCLKLEFGNPNVVTHLKLKSLFDQPQSSRPCITKVIPSELKMHQHMACFHGIHFNTYVHQKYNKSGPTSTKLPTPNIVQTH